ncbi:methionyl-tRNA formyltransferase [Brachybacterium sp. DNPG3]
MRLLFAGTPEAALPSLRALLDSDHEVVAVLTRADAPSGRGRKLRPSPVRALADAEGIEVITPRSLRDPEVQQRLRDLAPDVAPVVAYGQLIPAPALDIPAHGWINLHFSLLPQWRGAAPAQRAVLSGASASGISVFRIEEGLDTGDVLASAPSPIGPLTTSGELLEAMAVQGAELLVETLDAIAAGTAVAAPQDHALATHAAKLTPAEARIDWSLPADRVSAHIRGMSPDPGAWTLLDGDRFKVLGLEELPADAPRLAPGTLRATKRHLLVGTGTTPLALGTVAPAGKRAMRAADWARGAALGDAPAFGAPDDTDSTTSEERA